MSSSRLIRATATVATVAVAGLCGVAGAQTPADTTITVSPRVVIAAPQKSPIDFPGVRSARAGRPLPKGYAAIARGVSIARGGETAFAALRMTCPKGKTWRTGGSGGAIAFGVLDRRVAGKRSVLVLASAVAQDVPGATASGTVFALCR
ncbi:MAG: hypothetical protein QOE11_1996 [Solirubrobacteraceae bacterium]|jgi:hypothetical protein|nr:hypothetical protein [Solirubrobacteraceae bacterium]